MKNKKLLTRMFALLGSLVLVVALALPCFADETDQPSTDYVYKQVSSYVDLLSCVNDSAWYVSCIFKEHFDYDAFCYGSISYYSDDGLFRISYNVPTPNGFYQYYIDIADLDYVVFGYYYYIDGEVDEQILENIHWDDFELYVLVPASVDDDNIIEEQGWYGQIKNIIKDAVFGSDTVLNDSQEFTLNQISLWLSLIVILLPLIVVAVILVRCFR